MPRVLGVGSVLTLLRAASIIRSRRSTMILIQSCLEGMADAANSPSAKEDIMGLFDSLKNMFAHHEHHHGASIGQPLTLADAKAVLAFIVVHQQLADKR